MKTHIVYNSRGEIKEMGGFGFDIDEGSKKDMLPEDEFLMEISEEDYRKMEGKLEYFKVVDGKPREKTAIEKKEIDLAREKWRRENTIDGIRERMRGLEALIRTRIHPNPPDKRVINTRDEEEVL